MPPAAPLSPPPPYPAGLLNDADLDEEARRLEERERALMLEKQRHQARMTALRQQKVYQLQATMSALDSEIAAERQHQQQTTEKLAALQSRQQAAQTALADLRRQRQDAQQRAEELGREAEHLQLQISQQHHALTDMNAARQRLESEWQRNNAARQQLTAQLQELQLSPVGTASPSSPGLSSPASVSLPPSFISGLQRLEEQGFHNAVTNFEVLLRHGGNVETALLELRHSRST
jgi:hypothetical protein